MIDSPTSVFGGEPRAVLLVSSIVVPRLATADGTEGPPLAEFPTSVRPPRQLQLSNGTLARLETHEFPAAGVVVPVGVDPYLASLYVLFLADQGDIILSVPRLGLA